MAKVNIRESLGRLDLLTDNKFDLRNLYDAQNLSVDKKRKLSEAISKGKSAKQIYNLLNEDYDDDYDAKYDATYEANSYYGRDYRGLEDYIYTDDYSELEEWTWEKIGNGGYVEVFNRDSGKSVRLDPDKYDRESDDIYNILDDLRSVNESLNEDNHEQLYKVVIQSDGGTKRDFESGLYENEAEEIVDYYGGRWIDENGFEWHMYVEEDDESTEHSYVDESLNEEKIADKIRAKQNTQDMTKRAIRLLKNLGGDYKDLAKEYEDSYGENPLEEDTVKQNGKWVNKGSEGTHGKFKTKKEADAQRKAMYAQGFKGESLEESVEDGYMKHADADARKVKSLYRKNKNIGSAFSSLGYTDSGYGSYEKEVEDNVFIVFEYDEDSGRLEYNVVNEETRTGTPSNVLSLPKKLKERVQRVSASKYNSPVKEFDWDSDGSGKYYVTYHPKDGKGGCDADVYSDWRQKGRYILDRIDGQIINKGKLTRGEVQNLIRQYCSNGGLDEDWEPDEWEETDFLDDEGKKVYINIIKEAEDIDELKDIAHDLYWHDKGLFAMLRNFPKDKSFEWIQNRMIEVIKSTMNESLNEDTYTANEINKFIRRAMSMANSMKKDFYVVETYIEDGTQFNGYAVTAKVDPQDKAIVKASYKDGKVSVKKLKNESLTEASYGGAYDIEDDMFWTKDDLIEFSDAVCEKLADKFGYQYDIADVGAESNNDMYITIMDTTHDIEADVSFRIKMSRIRSPRDLMKYLDTVVSQFVKKFEEEYQYYDFDESLNEDMSAVMDDFAYARRNWDRIGTGVSLDDALEEYNAQYGQEGFYARPLYSESEWNKMVNMFADVETMTEAVDDEEIDLDVETDFSDGEVEEGSTFIEDGRTWSWIERIAGPIHLDFDNWAVWSARDWDYIEEKVKPLLINKEEFNAEVLTKIYEEAEVAYFVVDEDTGFIDWGPVETQTEAQDFLNGKAEDWENDEYDESLKESKDLKEWWTVDLSYTDGEDEYTFEVDGEDVIDYITDTMYDNGEYPDFLEGQSDEEIEAWLDDKENYPKFRAWVEEKFGELFKKYEDDILDYFREKAEMEHYAELDDYDNWKLNSWSRYDNGSGMTDRDFL